MRGFVPSWSALVRVLVGGWSVLLALLGGLGRVAAQGVAPQGIAAQGVAPPVRFERVLWCGDGASGPAAAKRLGYTAVQLGRGADPGPVRALGLGFYVDQPIGKGLLELRDDEWRPVVQQFERTRDAAGLARPGCFAVPGRVEQAARDAALEVQRVAGAGLLFVALADEASATRHAAPLDTCRCAHCLREFRAWAERRHRSIDALNGVLGTSYASFAEAVPLSTDQVRLRELGERQLPADLRAFACWLDFVDEQYAGVVKEIAERVQAVAREVPVGLTGVSAPAAFGGEDPARLLRALSLVEPYDIGGACELASSLAPASAHRYATLALPGADAGASAGDLVRARLAGMACQGLAGVVVWNDGTVQGADGVPSKFGAAVQRAFEQLGPALDACAGAVSEAASSGQVWVVESQPSVRVWWMLDSAADGLTWVRRLASYEATHSTSQSARVGWIRLLQDLGLQPRFVAAGDFAERLLTERPRCVVLPATIALADRAAQALTVYVQNGGTLLADHSTGLYDERLLRRDRGALDGLFGIGQRSLAWNDLLVREGRALGDGAGLPMAERALAGQLGQATDEGDAFLERAVGRGRACYLNAPVAAYPSWRLDETRIVPARELRRRVRGVLQRAGVAPPCEVLGEGLPTCVERIPLVLRDGRRVLCVRVNALERPALLARLAARGPLNVQLIWPRDVTLRELGGRDLGRAASHEFTLDPFGVVFVEVAP